MSIKRPIAYHQGDDPQTETGLITPTHQLFPEYRAAFMEAVSGDATRLDAVRKRADERVEIERVDRWKRWLKRHDPVLHFKYIHRETCSNFGKTRSL